MKSLKYGRKMGKRHENLGLLFKQYIKIQAYNHLTGLYSSFFFFLIGQALFVAFSVAIAKCLDCQSISRHFTE